MKAYDAVHMQSLDELVPSSSIVAEQFHIHGLSQPLNNPHVDPQASKLFCCGQVIDEAEVLAAICLPFVTTSGMACVGSQGKFAMTCAWCASQA